MILLTGGSGLLGTELQKHLECYAPSHGEFDILNPPKLRDDMHMIVHCAAYTDVAKAETEFGVCADMNITGTRKMARLKKPIVFISTEYVFDGERGFYKESDKPKKQTNNYSITKYIAEQRIPIDSKKSLIIRTVFKPRPFEHPRACMDMFTSGDYVDVIAPMIAKAIKKFESWPDGNHILHIGTDRKSIYELAKQSRPDVKPCLRSDIPVPLPYDTSLNCEKWEKLCGQD